MFYTRIPIFEIFLHKHKKKSIKFLKKPAKFMKYKSKFDIIHIFIMYKIILCNVLLHTIHAYQYVVNIFLKLNLKCTFIVY